MQALFMRGGVVFIALALIFVLSTSAQEPQKHERHDLPKPIWRVGIERYPAIPDSYFDGQEPWPWPNAPFPGMLGIGNFGRGWGGFGGGLGWISNDEWKGLGSGGFCGVGGFRPNWPADLSTSPSKLKAGNSRN
jgi:hypothetical protein